MMLIERIRVVPERNRRPLAFDQRLEQGVSEDLCRHDRKRASCLQPKNQILFQFLSLTRRA